MHTLDISFRMRDRDGTLHIAVVPNTDPDDLGHGLVASGYDSALFQGLPCITHHGHCQLRRDWPAGVDGLSPGRRTPRPDGTVQVDIDRAPVFADGSPLYAFGYLPTFSDFPANPDHPDGDWVAETFLVAIPDVVRSAVVVPVAAFSWGYRLRDHRVVEVFEPKQLERSAWDDRRALLHSSHPGWTFESGGTPI